LQLIAAKVRALWPYIQASGIVDASSQVWMPTQEQLEQLAAAHAIDAQVAHVPKQTQRQMELQVTFAS